MGQPQFDLPSPWAPVNLGHYPLDCSNRAVVRSRLVGGWLNGARTRRVS